MVHVAAQVAQDVAVATKAIKRIHYLSGLTYDDKPLQVYKLKDEIDAACRELDGMDAPSPQGDAVEKNDLCAAGEKARSGPLGSRIETQAFPAPSPDLAGVKERLDKTRNDLSNWRDSFNPATHRQYQWLTNAIDDLAEAVHAIEGMEAKIQDHQHQLALANSILDERKKMEWAIAAETERCARIAETIQFTPEQEAEEADCHCALIAAAIRSKAG
jgi:hypothetical protein